MRIVRDCEVNHPEYLNTPRAVRSSNGITVWRWDSDPFGASAPNEDPNGMSITFNLPLRFPGQYFDAETGTHYNMARDYGPVEGRYIQSDPIGLAGGLNTYAYVNSSPLTSIDELGLRLCRITFPTITGSADFFLDDKVACKACSIVSTAAAQGITVTVNEAFRTTARQRILYERRGSNPNVVARPGTSRHESGFALDLNVRGLNPDQDAALVEIARQNGFVPLQNRASDPPHFQADPRAFDYPSLGAAILENQRSYRDDSIERCNCK